MRNCHIKNAPSTNTQGINIAFLTFSSLIQTLTVGTGITPVQPHSVGRGLYRRWGISPRPEESLFFSNYISLQFHRQLNSLLLQIHTHNFHFYDIANTYHFQWMFDEFLVCNLRNVN